MYKKDIEYTNIFTGEEVTKALYFNLSAVDIARLNAYYGVDDISTFLKDVADSANPSTIIPVMENLILSSYGEPTEDGDGFVKTKEVREKFENSLAYADFFETILLNPEEMTDFVTHVISPNIAERIEDNKPSKFSVEKSETDQLMDEIRRDPEKIKELLAKESTGAKY